jgi:hypothetical protein
MLLQTWDIQVIGKMNELEWPIVLLDERDFRTFVITREEATQPIEQTAVHVFEWDDATVWLVI